ncbi:MAG: type II restriction endonuclease [Chloroflexota bacterium]|nr:type II restriction endonuclease [Chloroflexota bacterium]
MNDPRKEMRQLMERVRKAGQLPSSAAIVAETFRLLGFESGAISPDDVLKNFNVMLRRLWEETLHTLERYEEQAFAQGIPKEFIGAYPTDVAAAEQLAEQHGFRAGFAKLFSDWYPRLRRAFQSVSQGRMARGGKDFELQIEGLLALAHIPFDRQERKEHTDLILPNLNIHQSNRNISAVISIKRTLRERWAEVAEELFNLRSPNVYLFTADEDITDEHVASICGKYNIYLVVWDEVKAKRFPRDLLVLGYTEWASQRLAVLRQHWHQTP